MTGLPQLGGTTRALLAANLLLALAVTGEFLYSNPGSREAAPAESATTDAVMPDFGEATLAPPPMSQLVDMLERPLFYVARRIPEQQVEKAPPPPPTPLRLELEGIALASGAAIAVLRDTANNQLLQLAEGMIHNGWELDEIRSDGASFSRGQQVETLVLNPVPQARRR